VDITRFGSVIESEVEEHAVEIDEDSIAKVKAASREFLLLQKAECFLLRKIMKTRDAFDIYGLRRSGVVLSEQLEKSFGRHSHWRPDRCCRNRREDCPG